MRREVKRSRRCVLFIPCKVLCGPVAVFCLFSFFCLTIIWIESHGLTHNTRHQAHFLATIPFYIIYWHSSKQPANTHTHSPVSAMGPTLTLWHWAKEVVDTDPYSSVPHLAKGLHSSEAGRDLPLCAVHSKWRYHKNNRNKYLRTCFRQANANKNSFILERNSFKQKVATRRPRRLIF